MYQYDVPNTSMVLTATFVWFVSSEFRWLWLAARNRHIQYDCVREVNVSDEDGGLTVAGGGGATAISKF